MGRSPETETRIWSWLGVRGWKAGMKKRKDLIAGVGKKGLGEKPKRAQHIVVNNKQFGVSVSIQPSRWKIWISNLAIAFYEMQKDFMNLCLWLALAGSGLSNCITGAIQQLQASLRVKGRC